MNLKFSAIIPVYNVENYLRECLDSVAGQHVSFHEIILINDGSTDKSQEICEEYCARYPTFTLINQENMGLSEARNAGLRVASGDYIIFVDSDDYIDKNTVKILSDELKGRDLDILYYDSSIIKCMPINLSDYIFIRDPRRSGKVMTGMESVEQTYPQDYIITACMAAYKRTFLRDYNIIFERGILYEDRLFSLQSATNAGQVMYISASLYIRRYRENSIVTSNASLKKIQDVIRGQMLEWDYLNTHSEWSKRPNLKRYYVLCGAWMAMSDDVCGSDTAGTKKGTYISLLLSHWKTEIISEDLSLSEAYILLNILHEISLLKEKEELISMFFKSDGEYLRLCKNIENILQNETVRKLKRLPFVMSKRKVGIYGLGNHSVSMIKLYEKYVGEICSDIYFLDSNKSDETNFLGKRVFALDEIPSGTEYIVISSMIYQKKLQRQLEHRNIQIGKIIALYDAHDCVDFVAVDKLI